MQLKDLTIEEKLRLLAGKNAWQTEDLGGKLYSVSVSDGPVGVRKTAWLDWSHNGENTDLPSVAYPSIEVLSQTWDAVLARKMGECLADDCIEKNIDVLLAPGINIKRSPVCGRNFEYPSEDPMVAGVCAGEYIKGVQKKHVGTTLKHYLANNNEVGRFWASSNVDERTLREIYMRNFEIGLKAKPWAVMSSYNTLNGVMVSQNKEYNGYLREELGHGNGLIMSDWDAVRDHTASVKSGVDLEMPFNAAHLEKLKKDYEEGRITIEEIDACAQRVLDFAAFAEKESKLRKIDRTVEERLAVAQEIEEGGIVLLKNEGVLPIKNGQSVAVAQQDFSRYYAGGGSAKVNPVNKPRLLQDALKDVLTDSTIVAENMWGGGDAYVRTFTNADGKDVSIVMVGFEESEGNDRRFLNLNNFDNEDKFIKNLAKRNKNTVVVMFGGGVVDVSEWIDDVDALVYVGYAGEKGAEAIANVLCGKVCPSGKLTETFAKRLKDYPSENTVDDGLNYNYTEGMNVGYRYFDKHPDKVRFPFGFGLSYTSFEYSNIAINERIDGLFVSFDLENVGNLDGAEVSQVYVSAIAPAVEKPIKELRGFTKTYLKTGEKKRVEIKLDERAFYHYDVTARAWVKDAGEYDILVAESAASIKLKGTVSVK